MSPGNERLALIRRHHRERIAGLVHEPELIVFGTSSQVPTRFRNHNGYLLRWGGEGFLFDPGENTNRQMVRAGADTRWVTRILVTHFHGDHCLGLAGLFHRFSLERPDAPIHVHFSDAGRIFVERALCAADYASELEVVLHPFEEPGPIFDDGRFRIEARRLAHSIPTFGYRVSCRQTGGTFAFVMDTKTCPGALELAHEADFVICEATYTQHEAREARERGHMTAQHAAELARDAQAKKLMLSHFSQRYPNTRQHLKEAQRVFSNVQCASDLRRYRVPLPTPERARAG